MKQLLFTIFITTFSFLKAQEMQPKNNFELHTILNFGELEYGLQIGYNRKIITNKENFYTLLYGAYEEFVYTVEPSTDDGKFGNSISNQMGFTVTNQFHFLKSKKLYASNTVYAGWGYRRTKLNLVNELYDIAIDYNKGYHYFSAGIYWKAGYILNKNWSIQAVLKTDLSRIVDSYRPIFFEKPGPMIGVGVTYRF